MLYPSDIDYRPFSHEQVDGFATCAGQEYTNDRWWRSDLDDAARDLIIGYFSQQWSSPSDITRALKTIVNNPDRFFKKLARGGAGAMTDPVATSLRHGTGWTDDQLLDAANRRDEFIAGVSKEMAFLDNIKGERVKMLTAAGRTRWSNPDTAMTDFINRLAFIYQDAFWQSANVGLSNPRDGHATIGPFIKFGKAICTALKINLPAELQSSDFVTLLSSMALESSTALRKRFERTDYYAVAVSLGKTEKRYGLLQVLVSLIKQLANSKT